MATNVHELANVLRGTCRLTGADAATAMLPDGTTATYTEAEGLRIVGASGRVLHADIEALAIIRQRVRQQADRPRMPETRRGHRARLLARTRRLQRVLKGGRA